MEARGYVMPNYLDTEMINKDSKCRLKFEDYQVLFSLTFTNQTQYQFMCFLLQDQGLEIQNKCIKNFQKFIKSTKPHHEGTNNDDCRLGYTQRYLYELGWPHLHVSGTGGYDYAEHKDLWSFKKWAQFRINSIDGRFRWDPSYMYYLFDRLIRIQIKTYNQ